MRRSVCKLALSAFASVSSAVLHRLLLRPSSFTPRLVILATYMKGAYRGHNTRRDQERAAFIKPTASVLPLTSHIAH
ncbi:hypothetical protein PENSPDRAFT_647621 [Peniophora sp. CONT]|nr:hypothetical protein PENSPDRAFT_647621 [Peniophora sp. CONT]